MQERFLADIGDYLKFSLLRALASGSLGKRLKLAVVWCTVQSDGDRAPSRFKYLDDPRFASYDPDLVKHLKAIRNEGTIQAVSTSKILPSETIFVTDIMPGQRARNDWFTSIESQVKCASLIFLDPDNGICTGRPSKHHVSIEEFHRFLALDSSILVYHHLSRRQPHARQVHELLVKLTGLAYQHSLHLFWSQLGGGRVFVLAMHQRHQRVLSERLKAIVASSLGGYFRIVQWPGVLAVPLVNSVNTTAAK